MTVALHHVVQGPDDAPAIVLGNSLGTALQMWDQVVPLLLHSWRVVRYDHRGQGSSPVPPGPYEISDLGADVIALLDALSIAHATYCGVSIGGMVGLSLAARFPERINSLVAFCTSGYPGNPAAWEQRAATVLAAGGTAPIAEGVLERWLTPQYANTHPQAREALLSMLLASPYLGYAECCRILERLDLRAQLPSIEVPVLVVSGAQDEALPPEHGAAVAAAIPRARYELLDPAAHIPMVERPEAVARLIEEGANSGSRSV